MPEANLAVALLIKPAVLLLSVLLLLRLWRDRGIAGAPILALAAGLFLVGELFCAVDVYGLRRMTLANEGAHELLMALSAGVLVVGLHGWATAHFRCFRRICPSYWECRLPGAACAESTRHGTLPLWLLPAVALLGAFPLAVPAGEATLPLTAGVGGAELGSYLYDRSRWLVELDRVVIPLLGSVLLLLATALYARTRALGRGVVWLGGLGSGFVGFGLLRAMLVQVTDPALASLWEEGLEAAGVALLLAWWLEARRTAAPTSRQTYRIGVATR